MTTRAALVALAAFASLAAPIQALAIPFPTPARLAEPEPVRNTPQWNIGKNDRLAIDGYDPVAYFPEGGGKPSKGQTALTWEYKGALYRFASHENKQRFMDNPEKYEPAYGGWCAWAMREGDKVEVDAKSYIIKDDRLFLFYNGFIADTRAKWLKGNHTAEAAEADAKWKKLSGEDPHRGLTLKAQLDKKTAEYTARAPAEVLALIEGAIKEVADSGAVGKAVKVGQAAPDFSLPDAKGVSTSLSALLAKGPVVMVWYRGEWCPFCTKALAGWQDKIAELKEAGGTFVAISPEASPFVKKTIEEVLEPRHQGVKHAGL